jgi:hypothetical protein
MMNRTLYDLAMAASGKAPTVADRRALGRARLVSTVRVFASQEREACTRAARYTAAGRESLAAVARLQAAGFAAARAEVIAEGREFDTETDALVAEDEENDGYR